MASERQIAANRRNALKSTGPRSRAGKAKVAANALRHGLAARRFVTAHEAAAQALARSFCAEDPDLDAAAALALARAFIALQRIRQARENLGETALEKIDAGLHQDARRDLAALEALVGKSAATLSDYEQRANAALRKALKAL